MLEAINSQALKITVPLTTHMHARAERAGTRNPRHELAACPSQWVQWAKYDHQADKENSGACICQSRPVESVVLALDQCAQTSNLISGMYEARSLVSAKYGVARLSRRLSSSLDDVQMTGGLLLETLLSFQRNEKAKNLKKKLELALYDVSIIDSGECP